MWVINDTASQVPGCEVRADLCDGDGRQQAAWRRRVDVPAHSASTAGTVSWALPEGPRWLVRCSLARDGKTLASNEYDLGMHDGIQPAPGQRMWAWLSGLVSRL